MKKLSDYRAEARAALKENWLGSVMLVFVYMIIAGAICFFVGMFWAAAYHFQARTAFYETLKAEQAEIA